MASYIICENCKKVIEYMPERKYEGGTSYIETKCPECGHTIKETKNHVHYGNDGL